MILATAALTVAEAAPKKIKDSRITVAVYNVTSSKTRAKDVEKERRHNRDYGQVVWMLWQPN